MGEAKLTIEVDTAKNSRTSISVDSNVVDSEPDELKPNDGSEAKPCKKKRSASHRKKFKYRRAPTPRCDLSVGRAQKQAIHERQILLLNDIGTLSRAGSSWEKSVFNRQLFIKILVNNKINL